LIDIIMLCGSLSAQLTCSPGETQETAVIHSILAPPMSREVICCPRMHSDDMAPPMQTLVM